MMERRTAQRQILDRPVSARTRSTATVQVLDISTGGVRVLSEEPLAPRREIVTWLPTRNGEVRVRANVLRCRARFLEKPLPSGAVLVYEAGLAFCELSENERRAITDSYVNVEGSSRSDDHHASIAWTRAIDERRKTA